MTISQSICGLHLLKKTSQNITSELSNILNTSKRLPLKLESDRGSDWYNFTFQNFLENKSIHHYSRFTDKGPGIAGRVIRTIRNLLKKPVFEKGNANWISELPSITKRNNNTIHSSTKMTPIQTSKKSNEKGVFDNLRDDRQKQRQKFKLGQLVSTADIKRVFSRGDSTNYSYNKYKRTEVIHATIPTYRINYSAERYNENLFLPTKLSLDENNKVMKELILIQ